MTQYVPDAIEQYAVAHTTPAEGVLAQVAAATNERTTVPQMMSGAVEARLLEALVVVSGATRVLEIGAFTGYGALAMAAAMGEGGHVTTIEFDEANAALAREHIDAHPDGSRVDLLIGDAREIVPGLEGPFDLVYIDAWKPDYPIYYDAVVPKLAPRGIIVADNVLQQGRVLEPQDDQQAQAVAAFNAHVQADEHVHNALLSIGDGVLLAWRSTGGDR